jgi:hypothetical protein
LSQPRREPPQPNREPHRLISSRVNPGAVDHAIAAIFAALKVGAQNTDAIVTQEEFAARYRIPLGTLRDWEQGRAEPDQPTRAYLTVIAHDPKGVHKAIVSSGIL